MRSGMGVEERTLDWACRGYHIGILQIMSSLFTTRPYRLLHEESRDLRLLYTSQEHSTVGC